MTDGAGVPTGTPLSDPPLIQMISEDPVLRNTKLIAEAWDCDGLNQVRPRYVGDKRLSRERVETRTDFFLARWVHSRTTGAGPSGTGASGTRPGTSSRFAPRCQQNPSCFCFPSSREPLLFCSQQGTDGFAGAFAACLLGSPDVYGKHDPGEAAWWANNGGKKARRRKGGEACLVIFEPLCPPSCSGWEAVDRPLASTL